MIWAQGFVELLCWRRQRKLEASQCHQLVAECQRYLAQVREAGPPDRTERPRRTEPPHWTEPPGLA
jgi:hypothetical protein